MHEPPIALVVLVVLGAGCAQAQTDTGSASDSNDAGADTSVGGGSPDAAPDAASGGSGGSGGGPQACVPGQQIPCACPGGSQGAQACNATGTGYEPCVCPDGGGGIGGSGGTMTGGSGGAAANGGSGGTSSGGTSGASGTGGATGGTGGGACEPLSPSGDPDVCPGATIEVTSGCSTLSGDTSLFSADYDPASCASAASTDVVYRFVAPADGALTVTMDPSDFDGVLYYATTCNGSASSCAATQAFGDPETIVIQTVQGQEYFVYVDGWTNGFDGPFTLSFSY